MFIWDKIVKYFGDSFKLVKRRWGKLILSAPVFLILIGIILLSFGLIQGFIVSDNRVDSKTNEVYGQGATHGFRHMSVYGRGGRAMGETSPLTFIDPSVSLQSADISLIRSSLQNLVDSSAISNKGTGLNSDGTPRGWSDAYSTTLMGVVATSPESSDESPITSDSEIVAVGGRYKVFHPFEYLSGGFLPTEEVDLKQIVLNDVLAWKFYNSYDVVGNMVSIEGELYTVIGVVKEFDDKIARDSGSLVPRCYIYFKDLENKYAESPDVMAIECYEAMLPEAVKGVAINDFKSSLPSYSEANPLLYVVSNTDRYSIKSAWDFIFPIGDKDEFLKSFELPYWERMGILTTKYIFTDTLLGAGGIVLIISGTIALMLKYKRMKLEENAKISIQE